MPAAPDRPLLLAERARARVLTARLVRSPYAPVALATAAAVALRFPTLAGGSFWLDEWFTHRVLALPVAGARQELESTESSPPLYYVLAWSWTRVFGDGEVALRSLSWLFGAATVPAVYLAASALSTRRAGAFAAALAAVSPLLVWYSTEARAYALLALLAALSLLFFARLVRRGDRRDVAAWAAVGILALWTHYFASFLIFAEAVVAAYLAPSRRVLAAAGAVGLAALPLIPIARAQHGHTEWIASLDFSYRLVEIPRSWLTGISAPTYAPTLAVFLLAGAALLVLRVPREGRRSAAVPAAVAAIALALPVGAALVGFDYVLARNMIGIWPAFAAALAVVLAEARPAWAGALVAAGLCAVSLVVLARVARDPHLQRPDWKAATRALGDARRDRLVAAWGLSHPLLLYLPRSRPSFPRERVAVSEIDLLGFDGPGSSRECWTGAACNIPRVSPTERPPAPGFRLADVRRAGLFRAVRFVAPEPVVVEPIAVFRTAGLPAPKVVLFEPAGGRP